MNLLIHYERHIPFRINSVTTSHSSNGWWAKNQPNIHTCHVCISVTLHGWIAAVCSRIHKSISDALIFEDRHKQKIKAAESIELLTHFRTHSARAFRTKCILLVHSCWCMCLLYFQSQHFWQYFRKRTGQCEGFSCDAISGGRRNAILPIAAVLFHSIPFINIKLINIVIH